MRSRKFISFKENTQKQENVITDSEYKINPQEKVNELSISISIESAKLIEASSSKNFVNHKVRELVVELKNKLETVLSFLPEPEFIDILNSNNPYYIQPEKEIIPEGKDDKDRLLENGGMAPPKLGIHDMFLRPSEKFSLIEEMRLMKKNGLTVNPVIHNFKIPVGISDFVEAFKSLEHLHDYNGNFLVSLLKSEMEIDNTSKSINVELSKETVMCSNGDCLILSVYDISGSVEKEEKKFIIIILFDKLNGTLKYGYSILPSGGKQLSDRQRNEIENFCKSKNIIH